MMGRALAVLLSGFASLVLLGVLIAREELPAAPLSPARAAEASPLRALSYQAASRRANLEVMGFSPERAGQVAAEIEALAPGAERYRRALEQDRAALSEAFCPRAWPQPWAALPYLAVPSGQGRAPVDAGFDALPRLDWADEVPLTDLVARFEGVPRPSQATLMGVAAVLAGREADALAGRAPWSGRLPGGFDALLQEEPGLEPRVVRYFALLHLLTELANGPDGICG